jgi:large subunit ribosomal protein L6
VVSVKGPKGELSQYVDSSIIVKIADGHVELDIDEKSSVDQKQKQAFHGLYRALINNMVVGVSEGYKKTLELGRSRLSCIKPRQYYRVCSWIYTPYLY